MNKKESLGKGLNEIKHQSGELKARLAKSKHSIQQRCDEVTAQVDSVVQLRIQKLNNIRAKTGVDVGKHIAEVNSKRAEFAAKIKIYQDECIENMAFAQEQRFSKVIEKADDFVAKWLPLAECSSGKLKKVNQAEIDEHLDKLSQFHSELNAVQFSGRLLTFAETKDPKSIGTLGFDELQLPKNLTLKKPNFSLPIGKCSSYFIGSFLRVMVLSFLDPFVN
jgi:SMC interacting uncharacterized protein involved in chromosome segregation